MFRFIYKSKIHRATVTEANLDYAGSITIDQRLLKAADIFSNERVQVVNVNNGTRVETYAIPGKSGSGIICMNGAAARWAHRGDKVIIISYCLLDTKNAKEYKPKVVHVDDKNRISKKL
ncbi:MAG: aspartate 1-decarboxylase [Candidatus Omnitrophica bacterium CG12_big_fil_rev_8_21_14_0_65_43_15]|uniref:Aspartate 1-decarboxylase n=1 Tax=Candidatus Taenaricola geysiri TaxID=1974752 RepID=A0A2J0LQS4_9BACT|nr:MAG: aspartate 1-decarboxylase [Candidatus Omnitrophica bacterium CG1_02_43_210]PIW66187.1 MAG: aspartate 1-decarboxylase [Candidatus Omnitrophica bacterium CG12_big_fil_rev_8_21_14_0_65_43_15]PIW80245.1 MAG: aspartate 1-decarboxylase [Candidatus Omnitrophica bacterium CG_4_8_14_3_um_filter_43_15]PIY84263.1 MAG: aspartate 1-decarboxylase [Candidatus Omnitrophica bacterium CG_4_10_14_0_8_um_filter_43_18]